MLCYVCDKYPQFPTQITAIKTIEIHINPMMFFQCVCKLGKVRLSSVLISIIAFAGGPRTTPDD